MLPVKTSRRSGTQCDSLYFRRSTFLNIIIMRMHKIYLVTGAVLFLLCFAPEIAFTSSSDTAPVNLSLYYPVQLFNEEYAVYGLRCSVLYGRSRSVSGVDIGFGLNYVAEAMNGVQIAVIGNGTLDDPVSGELFRSSKETNGIQIGGVFSETTNMRGIQISGLINSVQNLKGVQIGGLVNRAGGSAYGLQFAGLWNGSYGDSAGLMIGALGNQTEGSFTGLQAAGLWNLADSRSRVVQIAGITNISFHSRGVQISGIINFVNSDHYGMQASLVNYSEECRGLQMGFLSNINEREMRGTQIGLVNIADTVSGVQIGLVNYTRRMRGVQIGIINIISEGTLPFFPIFNFSTSL